ncbi:MAG: hypothetical protein K8S15_14050 [Candidatus Aegiribacteria sp.]|nr:hypothetical protein [Candidatus Aegiribacteria sp.]
MNSFLIPLSLLFLTGLSSDKASLVDSVDELVSLIEEDSCLGSRRFHVTNPCMPPVGYTSSELLVRTKLEGGSDDLHETLTYMVCSYSYTDYLIISEYFFDEDGNLAFCRSIWKERNSGTSLHEDCFYFSDEETVACGYGDENVHEPSPEDAQRGSARLSHSEYLIEYYINARIPAPPVFMEQFDVIYFPELSLHHPEIF